MLERLRFLRTDAYVVDSSTGSSGEKRVDSIGTCGDRLNPVLPAPVEGPKAAVPRFQPLKEDGLSNWLHADPEFDGPPYWFHWFETDGLLYWFQPDGSRSWFQAAE